MTVEWEDPPGPTRGIARRQEIKETTLVELQAHPGRWARVAENVRNPNGGMRRALLILGCEVTSRTQPDRTFHIYARWPKETS